MKFSPTLPYDIHGNIDTSLLLLAEKVCLKSATLTGNHTSQILNATRDLLRVTNSYYSNRIESEGTHPIDIEKAMQKKYAKDKKKRDLQKLSLAHIETQKFLEFQTSKHSNNIVSTDFISKLHEYFYTQDGLEPFLNIDSDTLMQPGQLREKDVAVDNYIAPPAHEIVSLMQIYQIEYQRLGKKTTQAMQLLNALCAHHRLLWIHPFLDGNGRISRLFLDAMLYDMKLEGYGLWNISRGLAREIKNYQSELKYADMIRQGSKDGKGNLSLMGLSSYLKFMLQTALDQIDYMQHSLNLATLSSRMQIFIQNSQQGMYNQEPLPKYTQALFNHLLIHGEVKRGEVKEIIGKQKTVATQLIKKLLEMNYLESDSPKGTIRLKFNAFFASKLMPELIPETL